MITPPPWGIVLWGERLVHPVSRELSSMAAADAPVTPRMLGVASGEDWSDRMHRFTREKLKALEALQIATCSSAAILGFEEILGSVEEGKIANIVVLSANPLDLISNSRTITHVVHDGRLLKLEQSTVSGG